MKQNKLTVLTLLWSNSTIIGDECCSATSLPPQCVAPALDFREGLPPIRNSLAFVSVVLIVKLSVEMTDCRGGSYSAFYLHKTHSYKHLRMSRSAVRLVSEIINLYWYDKSKFREIKFRACYTDLRILDVRDKRI